MKTRALCLVLALTAGLVAPVAAETVLPNAEFRLGGDSPDGWKLSGGTGRWIDRDVLEVTGTGSGSNQWQCEAAPLVPGGLYHFEFRGRQIAGTGCVISGPEFANCDYAQLAPDWQWYGHVFRVPDNVSRGLFRLGQWETKGTVRFDAVRLAPTIPVYRRVAALLLGEGEAIREHTYRFEATFTRDHGNFHRPLVSATANFNSDRWCFHGDGQATYQFALPGMSFTAASAGFDVSWYASGGGVMEVSVDGKTWRALAAQDRLGSAQAAVPTDLLPAKQLWLRVRSGKPGSNFQVNRLWFEGKPDGKPADGAGRTLFADVAAPGMEKAVEAITLDDNPAAGDATLRVTLKNPTSERANAVVGATVDPPTGSETALDPQEANLFPGQSRTFDVRFPARQPGRHNVTLSMSLQGLGRMQSVLTLTVPDFYRSDYGELIAGVPGKTKLWWCDAMHKVPRSRPLPTAEGSGPALSAARNDWEAVQVVVRSPEALRGLSAQPGALAGPNGAVIPAANVRVLRVYYHQVEHPTDGTGVRDWWPDALPPLKKADVAADANQPLWVLVYVPKDAAAGNYRGAVTLQAEGWSATVPLRLHVWNFALPERNHLATAFGLDIDLAFRYHGAKTDADRRTILDHYFRTFAEHRISPYDPAPLDRFQVKFHTDAKPPRTEIDFARFDRAMADAVEKYHFSHFSLPVQGMGGGTFHERYDPQIGPFKEGSPEYQLLFGSQMQQIEGHLKQKGWLDMAYVYWFDEPDPKDYAFVQSGMRRLKQYAPGVRRMLTEEPVDTLAGDVDVWCPVSSNYEPKAAVRRQQQGEQIWWYVCCGPKAPYCTLFIDHPATELRVWHWQTWQRKITGTLVWSTNYWTSSTAFPNKPQNPYLDPMGYVSGYGTPSGAKQYWGNGDGRFIYPPEAAAEPGLSPSPVLEPPVSSIRWEMLREGVEDYEYLHLLRSLLAERRSNLKEAEVRRIESLLEVPPEITTTMTSFTTDPAPLYARRAAIAEAIEEIQQGHK